MEIKNIIDKNIIANFIATKIVEILNQNKKVLWFVTGGSSMEIISIASLEINKHNHKNLVVMLTDERYGEINHPDGNWFQLTKLGFLLPEAKLIPILDGQDKNATTLKFNENLKQEFQNADYKIGIFGIGADGHTAGILPQSIATSFPDLACDYTTEKFERITITPKTISLLDEGIVFMKGEEKWKVIEDLLNKNIDIKTQPAQTLKTLPTLTIFTDYQNK